ncbi:amidase [Agaricicola taiwanensis]|uniref:Amidase n=1 Tax=Agaricicola taiwanensis TaxID=591372 RepID=A0A8J2YFW2_9RHOB|nr:amidase [Agaricicola taiwanensis]GGE31955.1 amidase [Agaricicola taiwanensis]
MADLALLNLTEALEALEKGTATSVALTEACLARIETHNPSVNAFIRLDAEEALKAAQESDRERKAGRLKGRLHGIPLAHKDMFDRKGKVSTGGSKILQDRVATQTSTLLERLDAEGAIDLGALNMSEFAAGPTGHNVHHGDCRNAYNHDHISGGSSSGSGAAVGARLVFGALGSDTGGSIRLPAAFNGLTGLKATYGRITRHGAVPRSWSLDHVGPLARSARDAALIYQAIAGADPRDPSTADQPAVGGIPFEGGSVRGLRVGVPSEKDLATVDPQVRDALEASLKVLEGLGAVLVPVNLPDLKPIYFTAETIIKSEAGAMHREWLRTRPQDYAAHVRVRIEAGLAIPATSYIDALRQRSHLTAAFLSDVMGKVDVLHLPTMPIPVPKIADTNVEGAGGEKVLELVGRITQFTRPISLLGLPAVTVPCGFDTAGLPIAFQLVGKPFAEARILVAADQFQQKTDFHRQAPTIARTAS